MPAAGATGAVTPAAPPQRANYFEGSLAAGRLPAMSDAPVPPIGVLFDIPLPMEVLPIGELLMAELPVEAADEVEGMVVDGLMPVEEGLLVDEEGGVPVDAPVSSTFLPQAPSASKADKAATGKTAGLKFENSMCASFNVGCESVVRRQNLIKLTNFLI